MASNTAMVLLLPASPPATLPFVNSAQTPSVSPGVTTQTVATAPTPVTASNVPAVTNGPVPTTQQKTKRTCRLFSKPPSNPRYKEFVVDKLEEYPRGYASMAAFIAADIDGRVYRRFSYSRNRLLLWYQDRVFCLENELKDLDEEDLRKAEDKDAEARQRLISRRYDERYRTVRKAALENLDAAMEKYDALLLREHEIMSIKRAPAKMHKTLYDFMYDGKKDEEDGVRKKHLLKKEYEFLHRTDDFMILGNQDDAWLGSFAESAKYLLPKKIRKMILASPEERKKNANLKNTSFYDNQRTGAFVKGTVCAANTVLLVVPVIILYALSINGASGWLKIGVLLVFVVVFPFLLAVLTNASRSDLFAGSAGYCAVLIVFLTYSGP